MRTAAVDIRQYFKPVLGLRPWRAKLGVGSFLTFEFGPKIKSYGHIHGKWHLWIYQSNWVVFHGGRQLVDSDSDRRHISVAVRRLENTSLTDVQVEPHKSKTTFVFEEFSLVVSAADYLEDPDERDEYWLFFMPGNEALTFGPGGINLGRSDQP